MRDRLRGLWLMASTAFRADPARAVGALSITVFESLVRAAFPFWLKVLTEGALDGDLGRVWTAAVGYGASLALMGLTNQARVRWTTILSERTGHFIDRRLIELSTRIPTLAHHERRDYADEMELLRQERGMLGSTVWAIVGNVQVFVTLAGSVALLATIHPLLLLLLVFGLPSVFVAARTTSMHERAREETVERTRVTKHLFELATKAASAKELRIFGLSDELVSYHEDLWGSFDRDMLRVGRRSALLWSGAWVTFAVGYVGVLVFVTLRAVADPQAVTAGDVLMAYTIAGQLHGQIGGVAGTVTWTRQALKAVGRYLWLIDLERDSRPVTEDPAAAPERIRDGIELRGVTFRYPGTDDDVLVDVDLRLPAGSTVAVVGDNGAGKTTLVKLLCRLYDPSEGTIAVDDVDLRRLDVDEWRARTAGGFQDFAKFELLARETVGVGDLDHLEDPAAVEGALKRAHAGDVPSTLPQGLESQLGRSFDNGVELSTGQWQKLALGRAMMREAPLLLVLDEPTASLDAETEHALFERYAGAARRVAATNGAITILVSHRFSTVRMAELILVVDGGRVVEQGSHAELVGRGGLYAELFELQARAYR